ncbi:MAG: metal-dependent transcriptional regulator [Lachnospiraceae bacterium]|nr:metal-dependent transcriptional regulator [Lachnospiraceae bacterium]
MHGAGEDYIETIYILQKRMGYVRSVDVARELGFSRASVSRAVGYMRDMGLLNMQEGGYLELTEAGQKEAEAVYDRHITLTAFLMATSRVDADTAEKDACRIEHIISPLTLEGIKRFAEDHRDLYEGIALPAEYHTR